MAEKKIDIKNMNIYEKLSAITNEISHVAKNLSVGTGKNQYKAVGEADVLAAVKPAEEYYRVYSYPYSREIVETAELVTTSTWDGKTTEKKQQFMRIKTVYRFVDMDKPESYIDITTYGDGVDSQDKAPGKAMTYADKYALLKAYKIITGDDPDQTYSEDLKGKTKKTTSPKSPKELAKEAYPSRQEMMDVAIAHFGEQKILEGYKAESFDDISDAKWMAMYNKATQATQ